PALAAYYPRQASDGRLCIRSPSERSDALAAGRPPQRPNLTPRTTQRSTFSKIRPNQCPTFAPTRYIYLWKGKDRSPHPSMRNAHCPREHQASRHVLPKQPNSRIVSPGPNRPHPSCLSLLTFYALRTTHYALRRHPTKPPSPQTSMA